MNSETIVGVTSRSFSAHKELRALLVEKYPKAKFNETGTSLRGDALFNFLKDCDKAIIALEPVDQKLVDKLPNLNVISKYGVGLNNLDLKAIKQKDIKVGWSAGVNKRAVAELTLFMALGLLRRGLYSVDFVKRGNWKQIKGLELTNKTFGIVGFGNIGQDLLKLLSPFGCRVLVNDVLDFPKQEGVEFVDKKTLFKESDVVSVHTPLDENTEKMVSKQLLASMKKSAYLINTARGGIVDEEALYEALKNEQIAGAAFDVMVVEPPENHKLVTLDNFYLTPHIGGSSEEAILAMGKSAIDGLDSFYNF